MDDDWWDGLTVGVLLGDLVDDAARGLGRVTGWLLGALPRHRRRRRTRRP